MFYFKISPCDNQFQCVEYTLKTVRIIQQQQLQQRIAQIINDVMIGYIVASALRSNQPEPLSVNIYTNTQVSDCDLKSHKERIILYQRKKNQHQF